MKTEGPFQFLVYLPQWTKSRLSWGATFQKAQTSFLNGNNLCFFLTFRIFMALLEHMGQYLSWQGQDSVRLVSMGSASQAVKSSGGKVTIVMQMFASFLA